jgi:HD-like signal output (HDOD) protein
MAKCIESFPELEDNPDLLIEVMGKVHTQVSQMILNSWFFPKDIIVASVDYVDPFRTGTTTTDLADIVIIAGLNTYRGTDHPCTLHDWSEYPAFQKIGIKSRDELEKLDQIDPDIESARIMLGIPIPSSIK